MTREADIEKRLKAANKGPWRWNGGCAVWHDRPMDVGGPHKIIKAMPHTAEFIAHSKEDVEWLLAERKRLLGIIEQASEYISMVPNHYPTEKESTEPGSEGWHWGHVEHFVECAQSWLDKGK